METSDRVTWDVVVIGGGLAGISAAIYLGRALRRTLVIDSGKSLARWEPDVQNYLGFPKGINGNDLLTRGRMHARNFGADWQDDEVQTAHAQRKRFVIRGKSREYTARRLLLATGLFHIPPDIPGVSDCLGHSMFFCKDCDAYRVQGQRIAILGSNDETVRYALAMVAFTPCVFVALNGRKATWNSDSDRWLKEYSIPVYHDRIVEVEHREGKIRSLRFVDGECAAVDSAFTTRGDVYHNDLARDLGAEIDDEGQVKVDPDMRTSVPGLYAAGCVTPSNCQMIIAAGAGAVAAQAINRDLFEEDLRNHSLRRLREEQLATEPTRPEVIEHGS